MKALLIASATLASLLTACGGDDHDHDHDDGHTHAEDGEDSEDDHEHEAGPNGGELIELGAHEGHLEIVRDAETGALTLYLFGEDNETPIEVERAPELKLTTPDGPKVIAAKSQGAAGAKSAVFVVDDLGDLELVGRVSVYVGDKVYNPEL